MDLLNGLNPQQLKALAGQAWAAPAAIFAFFWILGSWRAFKAEYSAEQWALRPERHKALKALAYAGALPFRILFSVFTGIVEALVWSLLVLFAYLMWRVWHG